MSLLNVQTVSLFFCFLGQKIQSSGWLNMPDPANQELQTNRDGGFGGPGSGGLDLPSLDVCVASQPQQTLTVV